MYIVYNGAIFIQIIEHIIVDGGSKDRTIEIIKKYENQYNMIWISEPDQGMYDAISKGFRMATVIYYAG